MTGMKRRLAKVLLKMARRLHPPIRTVTYNINSSSANAAIQEIERRRGMGGLAR